MKLDQTDTYGQEREQMVAGQIERRGIQSAPVLEAMRRIPRHLFVPPEMEAQAYEDSPLPIGEGQTISQPYMVALMSDLVQLKPSDQVLEVGTGSGYQAAVLGMLAETVHTVERHANLARRAQSLLRELELDHVTVHVGDGSIGLPDFAPFNAILVTAAMPEVSEVLLNQLALAGRLVAPVGSPGTQILQRWVREDVGFSHEEFFPVAFVPLRGELGWKTSEW